MIEYLKKLLATAASFTAVVETVDADEHELRLIEVGTDVLVGYVVGSGDSPSEEELVLIPLDRVLLIRIVR